MAGAGRPSLSWGLLGQGCHPRKTMLWHQIFFQKNIAKKLAWFVFFLLCSIQANRARIHWRKKTHSQGEDCAGQSLLRWLRQLASGKACCNALCNRQSARLVVRLGTIGNWPRSMLARIQRERTGARGDARSFPRPARP